MDWPIFIMNTCKVVGYTISVIRLHVLMPFSDQLKRKSVDSKKTSNNSVRTAQPVKREAASSIATTKKKRKVTKPFDQILRGVNFVISGFQNPLRSDIREKALRMGAQYRRDWTPDSTHLM